MFRWCSVPGRSCRALVALTLMGAGVAAVAAAPQYNIVTASENGTYFQIGKDLATQVAQPAGFEMQALPSKGSVENIKRLRDEPNTKLALVQSDVYHAYQTMAARGNAEAGRIIKPLRVVLPLYNEEIYFVVRADSPLQSVSEIREQRINIGPIGSGTAMTSASIYRALFNMPMDDDLVRTMSNEEALIQLVRDKTVDVVVVIAGQPAALFNGMEAGVEKYFKLLKVDQTSATAASLAGYSLSTIKASSYPNWLTEDLPSLSVKTMLVTYDYELAQTRTVLTRFARAMCDKLPALQSSGHPKWREVSLNLPPLSAGWSYYAPTAQEMNRCAARAPTATAAQAPAPAARKRVPDCALQDKVMGLCPAS